MRHLPSRLALASACWLLSALPAAAVDVADTRLLSQPAISARHIAFAYAGDLWIADLNGQNTLGPAEGPDRVKGAPPTKAVVAVNVRRLTSDDGLETNPVFSPDGRLVAFSGQYDGNTDVFVMPVEGGPPTRLTWHPGPDVVQGFTPDGASVLFTSGRAVFTSRFLQLFTVPVKGGVEVALPIPNASRASYAPDGRRIAYNPLNPAFQQWKHYRGGTVSTVVLYRTSDHAIEKVPQPATRANDVDPMWIGDTVYFRSDRNGEFNLYSFEPSSKAITQLTKHDDFPVLNAAASSAGDRIVYEQAGYLHLFDPKTKQSTRVKIGVSADLVELRPRFVKGAQYFRNAAVSPSGARAAFEFRGEIVSVPAEKGDPRNLTNSEGAHDRSPAWSPDGKQIAYFSDASGEYALHLVAQDGRGETRKIPLKSTNGKASIGDGFYDKPLWSPDSQKIAFVDNAWSVFVLDVKSGTAKKVAQEPIYGPLRTTSYDWSPDSKWLAYTLNSTAAIQSVKVYSIDQDKSFPITDGLSEVSEPIFDKSGKYLFFFASTDAGPVKDWFAQSTADSRSTQAIYVAVLRSDLPSPIAKESDEEKGPSASSSASASAADETKKADSDEAAKKPSPSPPPVVRIDFDGLPFRILDLPIPVGEYSSLRAGTEGQFYYLRAADGKSSLQRFELKTRKTDTILPDVTEFRVTADGKKMLYRLREAWSIVALPQTAAAKKPEPSDGRLATASVEVHIDPRVEWTQIYNEAWRINRDYFYATNFHGVDWEAMRRKYETFLPHVSHRSDLNRVIQWMCSELAVGHHRGGGGDNRETAAAVPGGLLGADYDIANGRYRFQKIYGGLNWNPELRAPLTEPGVNAKTGEYLLAVNGRDLRPPANLYSLFENTSGKITEITIGPNADGSGSRTVPVVPIATEAALRNRDWVEGNLRKVEKATGGRVAYVYVPNTAGLGFTYFKRYFYPQSQRDAIIVDERFNGGGQVADYYIDILRRKHVSYWATRYGADLETPSASIDGPKVMITDETAGSGGDLLPFMFRQAKLGTIVGKRTWGGLVGVLGFPVLMDGGTITAPNLAIWTEDGFVVENEGVPPDVEVEQTPADVIAGRDPQLEKAIELVMKELESNPPKRLKRPPYPVRAKVPVSSSR